ncbi:MAG: hypothetical protein PHF46_04235 [Candidatus Gracilibacteria bacterium]|nr:hypothetical protein [Candidatus Gracilibacteria bacterium]MDD3120592.1 hypothetical protein [Candidatus Gracilibacteria bacterium]MDD4530581.1 hypothetical protein [Candidatus Gracilibacteria bacterium]
MNLKINTTETKKVVKENVKEHFNIQKGVTIIGIIAIENKEKRDFIVKGLSEIGLGAIAFFKGPNEDIQNISFVEKLNSNMLPGFDFFVSDEIGDEVDIMKYMKNGIVPIMPEQNTFTGIIKPFNPMMFEGNAFLFKKDGCYNIFERIVAYLENIKFPEDRRILIKNVLGTFD